MAGYHWMARGEYLCIVRVFDGFVLKREGVGDIQFDDGMVGEAAEDARFLKIITPKAPSHGEKDDDET